MNSLNVANSTDTARVQSRLQVLLHKLLVQIDNCTYETPEAIPLDADLSTFGVTSIDFLEFALTVEQEFHVAILETITPDELPQTLATWQQQISLRLAP
jgi:hypothetical protein